MSSSGGEQETTYLAALPQAGWGGVLVLLVHWDHGVPVFWQQTKCRSLSDGTWLDPTWGHWLSPSPGWERQMPSGWCPPPGIRAHLAWCSCWAGWLAPSVKWVGGRLFLGLSGLSTWFICVQKGVDLLSARMGGHRVCVRAWPAGSHTRPVADGAEALSVHPLVQQEEPRV